MNLIIKQPSAWVPIVMSVAMLAFILIYIVMFGIVYHEDEGTPAHIFQLWLVIEVFLIAYFVIKWLPQKPKETLIVLVIQIVAVLAACFPVFYYGF